MDYYAYLNAFFGRLCSECAENSRQNVIQQEIINTLFAQNKSDVQKFRNEQNLNRNRKYVISVELNDITTR